VAALQPIHMLASNINSLTHYAKGTLSFYFIFTRAAYKTTISNLSFTVLFRCRLYIIFSLRGRFPLYSNKFYSFYLFNLSVDSLYVYYPSNVNTTYLITTYYYIYSDIYIGCSIFIHTNHRISFDFFS